MVKQVRERAVERDKTHIEQVERWAEYVRENPDKWKAKLKPFIDGQFIMARRFYKKLAETEEGRDKIKLLRGIRCKNI
jgi:hypothetical protein